MKRAAWLYFLPALHVAARLTLPLGYLVPSLSYIAIVWTLVMIADFYFPHAAPQVPSRSYREAPSEIAA